MKALAHALGIALAAAVGFAADEAAAQAPKYPVKSMRMIVPFAPGGGTDIVARIIAQRATDALGHAVVVDNRPGAGGTLGAELAVRAAPDGYTLIMVSGSYATNAALYKLPYDPVKDIEPIVMIGESGFVIAVNPAVPIKSVSELITHTKAHPGKLNFGSTGTGGITHLATAMFELMSGTRMTHIPYKGTGPALTALLGNEVQLLFGSFPATIPHIKAGKLRGIGVTTEKPSPLLPGIPPVGETVKGYEVVLWYGIFGPRGLPKDIVEVWNREVGKIIQGKDMQERFSAEGIDPVGGPAQRFVDAIRRDVERWRRVVKEAKITLES
jgi:tripartite-type tricarboxylate transporter receptor subunit TctC